MSNKFDIKGAFNNIEKAIENISTNEDWINYLKFQTKFHNYSFNNSILIFTQKASATLVCGFKKWNTMDRYVKKGEKAIQILAPCKYKVEEETSEDTYKIRGFRLVSVFDISQTDGSEEKIPTLVTGLKKSVNNQDEIYNKLILKVDIPVIEVNGITAKGSYNPENKTIKIKSDLYTVQKIKTLIHEYSHHLHHSKYHDKESYSYGELIAESSAYIVCSYLGIDTSEYSFGYINSWCREPSDLRTVGSKIQLISSEIISKLEEDLEFSKVEAQDFC